MGVAPPPHATCLLVTRAVAHSRGSLGIPILRRVRIGQTGDRYKPVAK